MSVLALNYNSTNLDHINLNTNLKSFDLTQTAVKSRTGSPKEKMKFAGQKKKNASQQVETQVQSNNSGGIERFHQAVPIEKEIIVIKTRAYCYTHF
nr:8155_t:CDS:2 [Entrophospora candida]